MIVTAWQELGVVDGPNAAPTSRDIVADARGSLVADVLAYRMKEVFGPLLRIWRY